MSQSRIRGRLAVLATAAVAAISFAVPSSASAADITRTDLTLKTSWVNYISNPFWANPTPITTSWSALGSNTYGIPVTSASSSASAHSGSIAFDVNAHDIHVTIANPVVTWSGSTGTVSAAISYDPADGETVVSDTRDVFFFSIDGATPVIGDEGESIYNDRVLYLTTGGAQLFNGGSFGSYAANQAWGDISVATP